MNSVFNQTFNKAIHKVFVIAEGGVNHNGSLSLACQLADAALAAGADAIKFQTFRAEDVVTPTAQTADYQRTNTGATSQFAMIQALELSFAEHQQLAAHCTSIGIEFFSTPFSEKAVADLVRLGVQRLKLPSGEITNKPLIECVADTGLPLLMSTGMSTLAEVLSALGWIQARWAVLGVSPGLCVMHCTSAYPAPADALNLRAIATLAQATGLPVGYSDHSLGAEAAWAAVALGAIAVEKHLTLDKTLPGPDQVASADPAELAALVAGIRRIEAMLGDGIKAPQPIEANTRDVARRSIVTTRGLPAGHVLQATDLALRRPGTGLQPDQWEAVIGQRLRHAMPAHEVLHAAMLGAA